MFSLRRRIDNNNNNFFFGSVSFYGSERTRPKTVVTVNTEENQCERVIITRMRKVRASK